MRKVGLKVAAAGFALAVATLASGCSSIRDHRGYLVDQTLLDSVQPGIDNRVSVEKTLGRPTFESQFGSKDWYYISQQVKTPPFRKPRTDSQVVLRVRFDAADNVVGIDKRGVEQVARIDPDGRETPTLGRKRSLIEDLFGNIGAVGAGGMGQAPVGPGPNGS
ncbi:MULTISPECIES: outer membrane protein assembly factor BamE [Novosphingobium]|jgi:outer membrane protein assembly factor BamE (lipoprotein component of BamABCDE complex)|uniref:Beta-barrel assembly machine subunit BamE n=1 Tax=Novosphingobium panipatense TaxID=428991 RepID=A0ABY1QRX5_9SPHN|nr:MULTISPECIES: outer membrane protein assembly factor BamE [Novosphingobium]SMP78461.1 Beta-barrel assembly machine subunit BamE [Novosphingobium panipatense]